MFETRSDVTFDLLPAIDGLRALKSDLEAYYWGHVAHRTVESSERYQIGYWTRQLSDRAAALESIFMHNGTSRVQLRHVPAGEREAIRVAAAALNERWVREDEPFDRVLQYVALALAAADRIGLCAAGGTPDLVTPPSTGQRPSAARAAHERRAGHRVLEPDVGLPHHVRLVVSRNAPGAIRARPGTDSVTDVEP